MTWAAMTEMAMVEEMRAKDEAESLLRAVHAIAVEGLETSTSKGRALRQIRAGIERYMERRG